MIFQQFLGESVKVRFDKNNVDFLGNSKLKDFLYTEILKTAVGISIREQVKAIISKPKQCVHCVTLLSDKPFVYNAVLIFDNDQKSFQNLLDYLKQKRSEDKDRCDRVSYFYVIGAFGIEHTSLIMISNTNIYLIDTTPEKRIGTLISNFSNLYKERIQISSDDSRTQTDVCNCSFVKYLFDNLSQFTELGIRNIYINRYWDLLDGNMCFQTTQKYVEEVQKIISLNPNDFETYVQKGLTLVNEDILQSIGKDSEDARHIGIINESGNPILQSIACKKSKQFAKTLSENVNYTSPEAVVGESGAISKIEESAPNPTSDTTRTLQSPKVSVLPLTI